jgi:class 3 adenylate cyclase/tetratricopeptide (TPR) repeat protein
MREDRRIVTALFADIVGSTSITERLDPEDASDVLGGAVTLMVEEIDALGGTVKDLAGDGVLALFGAPVAHEDDGERAVLCGLRIVEAIADYAGDVGERTGVEGFSVRVGIETGPAILGRVGGGSRIEYGAVGNALNTAARLQNEAQPGTVLVGEATHRMVAPLFDWADPVSLDLKGKANPVRAFTALGHRVGTTRGLTGRATPMIGRDRESSVGVGTLERLGTGQGGIVFVTGEPGIGKSRLVAEWRAAAGDVRWLEARCLSYRSTTPMGAFPELLAGLAPNGAAADGIAAALDALLGPQATDKAPYLAALLGVEGPATAALRELAPVAIQFRTVEALGSVLAGAALKAPLVVALDDLHWADDSSLRAIERLLPLAERYPILFLLVLRNDPALPAFELLARVEQFSPLDVEVVRLGVLERGADLALLSALVGEDVLPGPLAERIIETSTGNPLFIEEFIRSLQDGGALVQDGSSWRYAHDVDVDVHVPATVERIIVARIDRLADRTRDALTAASILGRRFSDELLTMIMDEGSEVPAALDDLIRVDLVRPEFGPSGSVFVFKHSLIQEAAYQTLLLKRRRALHLRAADALALGDGASEVRLGELAIHLQGAGERARALDCRLRAARAAMRVSALVEARAHLDIADDLSAELEVARDDRVAVELHLLRGTVRGRLGDFTGGVADLEEALSAATSAEDDEAQMRVLAELGSLRAGSSDYRAAIPNLEGALELAERLERPRDIAGTLSRLSIVRTNLLDLRGAFLAGERALDVARASGEEEAVAEALDAIEVASVMIGDFDRVEALADELSAIYRRRGEMWYLQYAVYQSFWGPLAHGHWDTALQRLSEAEKIAEGLHDRGVLPLYLASRSWLERSRGSYGEALSLGRRAVASAEELGHLEWQAWGKCVVGRTLLEVGGGVDAIPVLEQALETATDCGSILLQVRAGGFLTVALLGAGDDDRASRVAEAEVDRLNQISVPDGGAYLQGAEGVLALASAVARLGESDQAEALLNAIVEPAERCRWIEVAAEAHLIRARVLMQDGVVDDAKISAERALALTSGGVGPGVAWRTHALLARLGDGDSHTAAAQEIVERLVDAAADADVDEPLAGWLTEALRQTLEGGASWV